MFIGFLTVFWYFYLDDHILYIFPNLACEVALEELIQNQEKYDDTWVRVHGEIWNPGMYWATLVPPGTGPESMTADEIMALHEKKKDGQQLAVKNNRKRLPEAHLTLWAHGTGTRTVSLTGIGRGKTVEIAGEFEKAAWYKGKSPSMDAAVVINPRQPIYWALVITYGLMSLLFIGGGIAFFVVSRKSFLKTNGCAAP